MNNKWFSHSLISWYLKNKRDLPWRHETDAYKIWLSEIILQQTQVAQGLSYYRRFVQAFPTVKELAAATEDEVLKLWQGLGYYSRARNLLQAANTVVAEYDGKFPSNYLEIKKLKGVGDYTAAAIASFSFNLPHAVVDGNVYRLLSRVFGLSAPIDSSTGKKQFQELATTLIDKKKPALHNQAIMEFGSQYCRPLNPDCGNCMFKAKCFAFANGTVSELPVKSKKTSVKERHLNYLVMLDKKGGVLIKRREAKDIWQGLYEFPLIETSADIDPAKLFARKEFQCIAGQKFSLRQSTKTYRHVLSHQLLMAKFHIILVAGMPRQKTYLRISVEKLQDYALPRLIEKFLRDCDLKEIL